MKTFNSLEEMRPYYNENTNAYEFFENGERIDIRINFFLDIDRNITAGNIVAVYIVAENINAKNINAKNITAENIKAWDIESRDIKTGNIDAWNINAWNINADNINADNINAININAENINAENINARDIEFYAVCFSYETFICNSIKGNHKNSKYFCLDSEVVINKKED